MKMKPLSLYYRPNAHFCMMWAETGRFWAETGRFWAETGRFGQKLILEE